VLERLGPPEEIVDAAEPAPVEAGGRFGVREVVALVVLAVGGVVPLLGYAVGAALVLLSRVWTSRQKLIGLAVGLPATLVILAAAGYEWLGDTELFFLGLALSGTPSAIYLGWQLLRR
jgi:hypothetical protein